MSTLYYYSEDRDPQPEEETAIVVVEKEKHVITIRREYPFTLNPKYPRVKVLKLELNLDEVDKLINDLSEAYNEYTAHEE